MSNNQPTSQPKMKRGLTLDEFKAAVYRRLLEFTDLQYERSTQLIKDNSTMIECWWNLGQSSLRVAGYLAGKDGVK